MSVADLAHLQHPSLTTPTLCVLPVSENYSSTRHCQSSSDLIVAVAVAVLADFLPASQYVVILPLPYHMSTNHTSVSTILSSTVLV